MDHHQYADTQIFLAMDTSIIHSNHTTLKICAQAIKHFFADNNLLLNANNFEIMPVGSSSQLKVVSRVQHLISCWCQSTCVISDQVAGRVHRQQIDI